MSSPLRIGILGSGFIAGVHASALKKIDGVELAAVSATDATRTAEFAKKHGIATHFTSFSSMLDSTRLDAVYICIPPFAHNGEVELAASRGLHVFLEKPIALNSTKAASMVDAIEKAGVVSQVGFHNRFRKSVRVLKKMIESGEAGKPTLFSGRYWTNMDGAPWWRNRDQSGGQVFEQVTHIYDIATYLLGTVESSRGLIRNLCHQGREDYSIEDTSVGTLQFKSGALGVITGSNCAVPVHFFGDFKVICEKVTLDYHGTGQHWVTPDTAKIYRTTGEIETIVENDDPYFLETADFINAIREGHSAATPARAGLEAIQLVESIIADAAR